MTASDSADPFIRASVVVPVFEDPEGIERTLNSLLTQTYPRDDHEILVVDNGSRDETPAVVDRFCEKYAHVRSLTEPRGGSYFARNAGIVASIGEILAFVDADMTVKPTWLGRVVDRMDAEGVAYLACAVDVPESGSRTLAERYVHQTAFPVERYVREQRYAPTCCLVVRRSLIDDVGMFDQRMTSSGDREFGNRVDRAGYDQYYAHDIVMAHPPRRSLGSLVSKAVRIGRGTYQLRRYYPGRYGRPLSLLLNPATYTPPLPRTMAETCSDWDRLTIADRLAFYALAWVLTLARASGKIREAAVGASNLLRRNDRRLNPSAPGGQS